MQASAPLMTRIPRLIPITLAYGGRADAGFSLVRLTSEELIAPLASTSERKVVPSTTLPESNLTWLTSVESTWPVGTGVGH